MTYVFDGTLSFTQPTNSCQFIFGLVFMYFLLVVSLVVSVNAVLCVEYRVSRHYASLAFLVSLCHSNDCNGLYVMDVQISRFQILESIHHSLFSFVTISRLISSLATLTSACLTAMLSPVIFVCPLHCV